MLTQPARRARAVLLALALALVLVPMTYAATIGTGETYEVASGETIEGNLYASGGTVRVDGRVTGDVIAAGGLVEVGPDGVVEGDLTGAGPSVLIKGTVNGDVRAAGPVVQADSGAKIGGEFIGAGYSVGLAKGASVGDDMMVVFGAQGLVDGVVDGDLIFRGAGLEINGTVDGNVDAEVDKKGGTMPPMMMFPFMPYSAQPPRTIATGLTLGPDAQIGGDLQYTSPEEIELPAGAVAGVVKSQVKAPEAGGGEAAEVAVKEARNPVVTWLIESVKDLIALFLIGLLLLWLTPRVLGGVGEVLSARALPSAGWGCLTVVAVVVGLIALTVATVFALVVTALLHIGPLIGPILSASAVLGVLMTFGMVLVAWAACVAVSLWIGQRLFARTTAAPNGVVILLVGAIIFALLINIPWVGGLIEFVGVLLGIGALVLYLRRSWPRGGAPMIAAMPEAPPALATGA